MEKAAAGKNFDWILNLFVDVHVFVCSMYGDTLDMS